MRWDSELIESLCRHTLSSLHTRAGVQHNHTATKEMCKEKHACAVLATWCVHVVIVNCDLVFDPFLDCLQATPSCQPHETGTAIRVDLLARRRPLANPVEVDFVGCDEIGDMLAHHIFPYWRSGPVVHLLHVVVTPAAAVRWGLTLLNDDVEDRLHHFSSTWASGLHHGSVSPHLLG